MIIVSFQMEFGLQMVIMGRLHFAMDTEYVLVTLSWPKNVLVRLSRVFWMTSQAVDAGVMASVIA